MPHSVQAEASNGWTDERAAYAPRSAIALAKDLAERPSERKRERRRQQLAKTQKHFGVL